MTKEKPHEGSEWFTAFRRGFKQYWEKKPDYALAEREFRLALELLGKEDAKRIDTDAPECMVLLDIAEVNVRTRSYEVADLVIVMAVKLLGLYRLEPEIVDLYISASELYLRMQEFEKSRSICRYLLEHIADDGSDPTADITIPATLRQQKHVQECKDSRTVKLREYQKYLPELVEHVSQRSLIAVKLNDTWGQFKMSC